MRRLLLPAAACTAHLRLPRSAPTPAAILLHYPPRHLSRSYVDYVLDVPMYFVYRNVSAARGTAGCCGLCLG